MAYEVTATRRRPRRFEDVIGQEFVVATLQKSITAGKIAHAYLFSGPRGCGKTTSARILARALNCEKGPTATPCGVCPACLEIARGSSLDVIEIDGASNTSVNDVRQIKDEVQFPPNSCRYKVYIIDEVHMLSTSAFNALLKTIEEPPPYVVFIFATTELHKVPATIKSRCQQFNVRLVPVELLKNVLAEAAAESGIKADEEALFWIAREATGSVRDAYTLFDQVAAFSDGHITYEKIRDKLGLLGVDRINPLAEACAEKRPEDALNALDAILQGGVSIEQITVDLADYFRSLLLLKSGITKESLLGQRPERFSARVLELWTPVQIERSLGIMLQLFRDIRYSLDPRYELELAISRLSWVTDYVSSAEMKAAIVQARSLLVKGAPAVSPREAQAQPQPPSGPQRGATGPFNDADRYPESDGAIRVAVREAIPATVSDPEPESDDVRIENPFAAFKQRLAGVGSPMATTVGTTVSTTATETRTAPEPSPMVEPAPAVARKPEFAPLPSPETIPEPIVVPETAESLEPTDVVEPTEAVEPAAQAIDFESLPESLVSFFQSTKNMVATGLSQASAWRDDGKVVHFSVESSFTHNLLEQDHKAIAQAVSSLLGRQTGIEIHLEAARAGNGSDEDNSVPPEVEMVRQMFRGTLAGGK
ncbi:MAG TPA: DNA polymerase III subunit gamma/tau [Treponemataceae bacterium]|nr:DNA polymerase III subunit gamma/tau [Treponemataceae bacterium]